MSLVPRSGGETTRAGPPYEDSAIIGYLVELPRGDALTFTLEGPRTPDAFEGSIVRSSGEEWLQCKRSAYNAGTWTIGELTKARVLEVFLLKAQGGSRVRFITDQRSVVG